LPVTSRRIGIVLVGCGGIGRCHAAAIAALPEARLVATVDIDAERASSFAQRFGAETADTDLAPLLERDDVDAVVVATANNLHAPLTIQALDTGKHVMVQKPIALTLAEADAMVAAADRSGKQLMVSFFEFFHPAFRRTKELVDAGTIGDVFFYKAIMAWFSPLENWRFDPAVSGGGILMDGHSHHVAYFNWLLNDPQIASVYSDYGTLASNAPVEDTGVTLIRTPTALAEISGSNRLLEPNAQNGRTFKESVEIFGTKGTIHIHPTERPSLCVFAPDLSIDPALAGGWIAPALDIIPFEDRGYSLHFNADEDPWTPEHRHFVECIRDGTPVVSDGRFGRKVHAITMASYASGREGRAMRFDASPVGSEG
jgi:myo-inositol 2-dehydrogenase/D-chiro-inositol 1-dehydrogenase